MKAFAKGEWKRAKTVRYKGNDEVGETDAEVQEAGEAGEAGERH